MPRVVVTEAAAIGLARCRRFLTKKAPEAAGRAGRAFERHFRMLETTPHIGRPVTDEPDLRELVIPFGSSGYVALYRYEPGADTVYVLAVRHQKEAGF